jgi:hypothetical protein
VETVRRAIDTGRYVLTDVMATGPAMFDTVRLDRAGGIDSTHPDPLAQLTQEAAGAGLHTAGNGPPPAYVDSGSAGGLATVPDARAAADVGPRV